MASMRHTRTREYVLWAVLFLPLVALVTAAEPIAQRDDYHQFADTRAWGPIPNALDVLSNLAFLVVGIAGLRHLMRANNAGALLAWRVHFAGIALVCAGSAWYHWRPDAASLVWDRLPMTVAFMGLFVALLAEHLDRHSERALLAPALIAGLSSVAWWVHTGDLRPYVWVQFGPLLAIPVLLALFPGRFTHRRYLLYGLLFYAAAKLAEHWDRQIFEASAHLVSGHTLKHLLAAGAPLCILRMLRTRASVGVPPMPAALSATAPHRP